MSRKKEVCVCVWEGRGAIVGRLREGKKYAVRGRERDREE